MDLTLLAPQPSSPSLQREVPKSSRMKTGAWSGPQRLMHFQAPIVEMGPQRGRGECSLSEISRPVIDG